VGEDIRTSQKFVYLSDIWRNLVALAEREGFEPSVRFHAHTLSKRAP
jgi:hypothetical protein